MDIASISEGYTELFCLSTGARQNGVAGLLIRIFISGDYRIPRDTKCPRLGVFFETLNPSRRNGPNCLRTPPPSVDGEGPSWAFLDCHMGKSFAKAADDLGEGADFWIKAFRASP